MLQAVGLRPKCWAMSRDPGRLKVFAMADELIATVYRATAGLPAEEPEA
jgi:hypothetical protein